MANTQAPSTPSVAEDADSKKEFEEQQRQLAESQGLGDGAVPEKRPIASQEGTAHTTEGEVARRLREAEDPRVVNEPMDKAAYDRAASKEQARKAAKDERHEALHVGAHVVIDNEDSPDHGRFGAITRVESFVDSESERLAAAGTPNSRFAEVESYEVRTRDGRHELLIVSAEHLKRVDAVNYVKNPT